VNAEQQAWAARMRVKAARDRARHHAKSPQATADIVREAEVLLPGIAERFGDTRLLQARRRDALEAEILHQDRAARRRNRSAA
jgi:hypothetical protein